MWILPCEALEHSCEYHKRRMQIEGNIYHMSDQQCSALVQFKSKKKMTDDPRSYGKVFQVKETMFVKARKLQ